MAQAERPPGSALYDPDSARAVAGRAAVRRAVEGRPAGGPPVASAAAESPPVASRGVEGGPAEGRLAKRSSVSRSVRGRAARVATPPILNGRWQDRECVPLPGTASISPLYVIRHYDFDDRLKRWNLSADVFSNDRCRADTNLLTYKGRGTFKVTGPSKVGSNIYEASFVIRSWQATPLSREGTLALFNARCGSGFFDEGRLLDLARSGCALIALRPLAQVSTGNELVRVGDGKVFLGARPFVPGPGNERPTRLSSYGLTRL
jgi:hypothetical protein